MSRKVRIATVSFQYRGGPTMEANRQRIARLLDQAVAEGPDVIALPETFGQQGVDYEALEEVAEPVPGPTVDLVAGYARDHGCYILCPLIVDRGDRFTNDVVLLDRHGEIAGTYSKVHPVVQGAEFESLELGITPGREAPVFDADFGRIGIQICFDLMFPEPWAELKRRDAEIIFWCSAYDGGRHLSVQAWNHRTYVVSAVQSRYAKIIDIMGDVVAETGWHDNVIAHTINLDVALFHCDFNAGVIPDIRKAYGPDVRIKVWHQEGLFTLESERPDLSVDAIVERFSLDPLDAYLARNKVLQDAIRNGEPVPDLSSGYEGRQQWL